GTLWGGRSIGKRQRVLTLGSGFRFPPRLQISARSLENVCSPSLGYSQIYQFLLDRRAAKDIGDDRFVRKQQSAIDQRDLKLSCSRLLQSGDDAPGSRAVAHVDR